MSSAKKIKLDNELSTCKLLTIENQIGRSDTNHQHYKNGLHNSCLNELLIEKGSEKYNEILSKININNDDKMHDFKEIFRLLCPDSRLLENIPLADTEYLLHLMDSLGIALARYNNIFFYTLFINQLSLCTILVCGL